MLLRADAGALPLADSSVDAIVTDPPAGISFMGRSWDADKGGRREWTTWLTGVMQECRRVLKPGGHAIVWALPRTSHWTATAIEDAGFEIRDVLTHHFGSGFPKSLDVSKAIDKMAGAEREVIGRSHHPRYQYRRETGVFSTERRGWDDGSTAGTGDAGDITAPATPEAARWQGWGTALKPSSEHWILARKPLLAGTVAANVLTYGTGALNIDACRVAGTWTTWRRKDGSINPEAGFTGVYDGGQGDVRNPEHPGGRWPPNLLLSHVPPSEGSPGCVQTGTRRVKGSNPGTYRRAAEESTARPYEGGWKPAEAGHRVDFYNDPDGTETVPAWACQSGCPVAEMDHQSGNQTGAHGSDPGGNRRDDVTNWRFRKGAQLGDQGGASRFFPQFAHDPDMDLDDVAPFRYVAKASTRERNEGLPDGRRNQHPCVKPVNLCRWLVRLVTPPGGVILDCFVGSGSTGVAAALEGFRFIGLDLEAEYLEDAQARIAHAIQTPEQPALFA